MSDKQKTRCFGCDGTGKRCNICGEVEAVCGCEGGFQETACLECGGTGR